MNRSEEVPDLMPASMVHAFVFCPRKFHLEWVQGERAKSAEMIAGLRDHQGVDRASGVLPAAAQIGSERVEATSVTLSAPCEGLIARLDRVEGDARGLIPIEVKHGPGPPNGGIWESDAAQVAAQALVLIENGYRVTHGAVLYQGSKKRISFPISADLVEATRGKIREARRVAQSPHAPAPLVDSPNCSGCSFQGICLPDEIQLETGSEAAGNPRPILPARDDALPIYIQAQGAKVGNVDENLELWEREKGTRRVRLIDVSQLCLFGNVTLTAPAISVLLGREIPICHFSYGGWFYGLTQPISSSNVFQRIAQHRVLAQEELCLPLARGVVVRKIQNQRTLLRRNANPSQRRILEELSYDIGQAERAADLQTLRGHEGTAARRYFSAFSSMLRPISPDGALLFDFQSRNRRPPRDPVNALLSLAYSILCKDWLITLAAVGLEPFVGFYHQPRFGRPALALDLMEEFRPLIADSVVLQLINNGEVKPSDFQTRGDAVSLEPEGRRKFFLAYERRMAQTITHPLFGYTLSYRRLLEVQARLFARHILGELPDYPGFTTR